MKKTSLLFSLLVLTGFVQAVITPKGSPIKQRSPKKGKDTFPAAKSKGEKITHKLSPRTRKSVCSLPGKFALMALRAAKASEKALRDEQVAAEETRQMVAGNLFDSMLDPERATPVGRRNLLVLNRAPKRCLSAQFEKLDEER